MNAVMKPMVATAMLSVLIPMETISAIVSLDTQGMGSYVKVNVCNPIVMRALASLFERSE